MLCSADKMRQVAHENRDKRVNVPYDKFVSNMIYERIQLAARSGMRTTSIVGERILPQHIVEDLQGQGYRVGIERHTGIYVHVISWYNPKLPKSRPPATSIPSRGDSRS